MIELTYKDIVTTQIAPTLRKLNGLSVFDARTAYRINKIHEKVREYYIKSMQEFEALGNTYAQRDADGNFLKDEKGQHVPLDGMKEKYEKVLSDFLSTKFEIKHHKLHVDALTARLSGEEIASLIPILEGLDDQA